MIPEGHVRHLFRFGSFLDGGFVCGSGFGRLLDFLLDFVEFLLGFGHAGLEALDALAEALHEFGNLLAAEEEEDYQCDYEYLPDTEILEKQYRSNCICHKLREQ